MMDQEARIYVTDPGSFIGSSLIRVLQDRGYKDLMPLSGDEPEIGDRASVDEFFRETRPEYVYLTAGRSAGIKGNISYPAELMLDNLLIECNVIDSSFRHGVKKLLYLASSCCYPRDCPQPMREEYILTGSLEPTNEAYALAKIAGIKLCQAYRAQYGAKFITAIPANIFGPGDDFSQDDSHVIAALINRFHEARHQGLDVVDVWGSGKPRRDFIYVDDLAQACLFLMENYESNEPINIGSGRGVTIRELAELIKGLVYSDARLSFDISHPDGMPEKVLDTSRLKDLGWSASGDLAGSLARTYEWYEKMKARSGP
jgi:GDP-L-fucose synthase